MGCSGYKTQNATLSIKVSTSTILVSAQVYPRQFTRNGREKILQMPSGLHRWASTVGHVHFFPLSSLTEEFEAGIETETIALGNILSAHHAVIRPLYLCLTLHWESNFSRLVKLHSKMIQNLLARKSKVRSVMNHIITVEF